MKIVVVGGGAAGFINATILKRFLNAEITVIHSSKIETTGVGEGSTEHISEYLDFIGIDHYSFIKECDATYKAFVYFDGWTSKNYGHFVSYPYNNKIGQYNYVYANQIAYKETNFVPQSILENKISTWFLNRPESPPFNQFHFNANKLNAFLQDIAKGMGIEVIDDEITETILNDSGQIDRVIGKKNSYSADFFVDASGFKRILIEKMNPEWISFSRYLKVNSAIVFPTEDDGTKEYNLWTRAKAMDYGWAFTVPVWGRFGNGYIYSSEHASKDKIKEEVIKKFGDVNFGKEFSFDPGYLKESWIKNCCAIGLSAVFVEPLEATSIGTIIQQSFLLMHKISNYSKKDIEEYNKSLKSIMENIRDFIFLHYMVDKDHTTFWKEVGEIDPPDTLAEKLELWQNRLPIQEDFCGDSRYILFKDANFIVVMAGLGLIDSDKILKGISGLSESVRYSAMQEVNQYNFTDLTNPKIGHKEMISLIRKIA